MAKDYLRYTADDFIADEFFQRWVRYPDRETNAFWKNWINEHPEQRDDIVKASAFINHLNFRIEAPEDEKIEASLNQSLRVIQGKESNWLFRIRRKTSIKKLMWITLVCAAIFLSITIWKFVQESQQTVEVKTGDNEIRNILLPDSTIIILNANAFLKYPSAITANNSREVWLKGEAFFNVSHSKEAASVSGFTVHSDDLDVEVTGTSFNVRKIDDISNVSLNTGIIRIRLNDDKNSIIYLNPGDFFTYAKNEKSLLKKKVRAELYSCWKDGKMELENTPLSTVAALIHDTYGYDIIIENDVLKNAHISGILPFKNEQSLITALSIALDIDITKKDKNLYFKTKTNIK